MRRFYLQIYATVAGILLLFSVLASLLWFSMSPSPRERRALEGVSSLVGELLPPDDAPAGALQAAVEALASRFGFDLAVSAPDGTLLASAGKPLPALDRLDAGSGWLHAPGRPPVPVLHLPDGRWLVFSNPHARHGHALGALATLIVLAGAVGLGAYPLVRRTTRRIERLQQRLDELGEGDLGARVQVEGRDEVANLARRFNRAAERIETLVNAQRNTLASASHELRAPLARIRMAVELLDDGAHEALRERVSADIAELDELIEELLLASRLDGLDARERWEPESGIDLLALLAEEAARFSIEVEGDPLQIRGDRRMLRRLVRNLLENARRYGGGQGATIDVRLESLDVGSARLRVCDRGAGVPESERERIFEPFYRRPGTRDGEGRGVGLGLALVRQIARHHGGSARCTPRPGGGTCFEVILPETEPAAD